MTRYIFRGLLETVPVLFGVSLLAFAIMHVVPGDPVRLIAGSDAPESVVGEILSRFPATLELTTVSMVMDAPHVSLLPGLAIFIAVMGFKCLGDGLRDALDPRVGRVAAE
jgi:ABC-type dipeptide/oligopeptide/nickel transport system permease component